MRTLSLKKETLTELSTRDLVGVVGGVATQLATGCLCSKFTDFCPTLTDCFTGTTTTG